ncbi:MAG TPA: ribulose-phosphate 3-epimerase [Bellilinea sp.]|nr:ribulose-phosphate 3-epimerase [Bellilinea sp.]
MIISASILSADFTDLRGQILQAEEGGTDWIHIDVMDGHFVPNITMGPIIVEACRRITQLPLDVHLMIEKPERHVEAFIKAGASYLSVHVEGNPNIHRTLQEIRSLGAHPGIVINPGTPVSLIAAVIPVVDFVLVMSVNPGFSGQSFIPGVAEKIREVRQLMDQLNPRGLIEVDGGITAATLPIVQAAGVEVCVAATAIFKYPGGIAAGIRALRSAEIK